MNLPNDAMKMVKEAASKIGAAKLSGIYVIKNVNGLALDVKGASQADNAPIITWDAHGSDNQKFSIELQSDMTYKIAAIHSGKVLTVVVGGDKVVQSAWSGYDSQKWEIAEKNGIVKFTNKRSGKVLDIPGNSSQKGTEIWVYPDNGTLAQQFRVYSA